MDCSFAGEVDEISAKGAILAVGHPGDCAQNTEAIIGMP
jgi:hypothetical protein